MNIIIINAITIIFEIIFIKNIWNVFSRIKIIEEIDREKEEEERKRKEEEEKKKEEEEKKK